MQYSNLTKKQLLMIVQELTAPEYPSAIITNSADVHNFCVQQITDWQQEHFIGLYLDGGNKITKSQLIFKGTLNQSLVHPREIFFPAIASRAASIIIAHNHPTGRLEPSIEDRNVTNRLVEAGKLLGIPVIDHVIFSPKEVFSFRAENLL